MWFIPTLLCTLAWGAADLFYKRGASESEKYSHLRTSICVGLVMGAHAILTLIFSGVGYDPVNILVYLPVSAMYILSMTVGYFGLRYLELSVSSPVQNASGALVCIMCLVFLGDSLDLLSGSAVTLICAGVFLLGVMEYRKSASETTPDDGDRKYRRGLAAFSIPLIYCVLDAAGTFFDAYYLDDVASTPLRNVTEANIEDVANISYELTFLICALIMLACLGVRRLTAGKKNGGSAGEEKTVEKISPKLTAYRFGAAAFETAGQFAYVYAMSGNGAVAAPVIASYCVVSVVLSRIFLGEKLKPAQYGSVALVAAGIILLGIVDGMAA